MELMVDDENPFVPLDPVLQSSHFVPNPSSSRNAAKESLKHLGDGKWQRVKQLTNTSVLFFR
jgi:hypothetical protein